MLTCLRLTKYYPPDFDPSAITRTKKVPGAKVKLLTVRLMAPFSMRCTSCGKLEYEPLTIFVGRVANYVVTGEYIYKGRKFNARKETTEEKYLSITIYRFYIRCTVCCPASHRLSHPCPSIIPKF
jgi:hypothetical protein